MSHDGLLPRLLARWAGGSEGARRKAGLGRGWREERERGNEAEKEDEKQEQRSRKIRRRRRR
eukprot:8744148-Pyramimonas_sp.AAC.1